MNGYVHRLRIVEHVGVTFTTYCAYACMKHAEQSLAHLREMGTQVVDDFIAGRWSERFGRSMDEVRSFLLGQLLEQCKGFSTREYRVALNAALGLRSASFKVRRLTRANSHLSPSPGHGPDSERLDE